MGSENETPRNAGGLPLGVADEGLQSRSPPPQGKTAVPRPVNYLLDANVICEPAKLKPDAGVLAWLAEGDEDRLHLSAVTLAEIQRGVSRLPPGARRGRIQRWLEGD